MITKAQLDQQAQVSSLKAHIRIPNARVAR